MILFEETDTKEEDEFITIENEKEWDLRECEMLNFSGEEQELMLDFSGEEQELML